MTAEANPDTPNSPMTSLLGAAHARTALLATEPNDRFAARAIDIGHDPLPVVSRRPGQLTVLDVTKWFGETSGGVRTYLEQKSAYVARRDNLRHVLVIPAGRDLVTDQANARWYRLRGPRIPTQRQYRFLLAVRSLQRIIAHERPDVIEVGSPVFVPWIAALAARGLSIPLISFYHTNLINARPAFDLYGRARRRFMETYVRQLDRLFTTTLVASESARADLRAAGVESTTRVSLGVDLETFAPWRCARLAKTRARLGVAVDKPLVVYAGRLAPEKSLDVAVEGWRRFDPERHATLLIIGDGPGKPALEAQAAGSSIRFMPFEESREQMADTLAASDIFLAPGALETFGLSAIESLACGTPVVSADAGGVSEHVMRSRAGVLFRHGDAESVATALRECFAADPKKLGAPGRAFVEREHGWDTVFDRIFDVYRDVIARSQSTHTPTMQPCRSRVTRPSRSFTTALALESATQLASLLPAPFSQ
jgi:alpha-1,6-mannosyltransferase